MYSSFPARESLGLISYVTASQLLGLSPRTHFCYFLLIIQHVIFANAKIKKEKGLGLHQPAKCHYIVSDIHLYRWYSNRVFLFIIHLVHFANAKIKKRKDCGLASTAILNFWLCDRLMTLVH